MCCDDTVSLCNQFAIVYMHLTADIFEIKMYHEFMPIYNQKLMNFNAFYLFIKFDIE